MNALSSVPSAQAFDPKHQQLKTACKEVEGLFVSILLKEGLKNQFDDGRAGEMPGKDPLQQFAIEQTARELGQQGSFGVADILYRDLSPLL